MKNPTHNDMAAGFTRRQPFAILALVCLYAWSVARLTLPPKPVPASAPDTVFSAERAMHHLGVIAQRPHPVGSVDHARVRDYIIAQLTALGVKPEIQSTTGIGTRYQSAGHVENIIATLPGSGADRHAVLLDAHYDGVGAGPSAADDGGNAAALLETLRALRARKKPLAHDVIFLFSDGEEDGLLGAAAFVREHPLAKNVSFIMNFETRGTTGRAQMFETSEGNMSAVRALRAAKNVNAGSVSIAVYRTLSNDTDLSELSQLKAAALNFAFIGGVDRYHTSHDDSTFLNPGSVQHIGDQMLAVTKSVADGVLPRPKTSDAVFFDLPVIGLVMYPVSFVLPIMAIVAICAIIVIQPMRKESMLGAVAMVFSTAVIGLIARSIHLVGPAQWSALYAGAIVLVVAGVSYELSRLTRRIAPNAWGGALVVWLLFAVATSLYAPIVSYLFVWPLSFALIAARSRHVVAQWAAAVVTLLIFGGFSFVMGSTALGLNGDGAVALAVCTCLITWLLLPVVEHAAPSARRTSSLLFFVPAAAIVVTAIGLVTPSAAHPMATQLVYSENTQNEDAFFGTFLRPDDWTRLALRTLDPSPGWVTAGVPYPAGSLGHTVPRVGLPAPTATLVSDTTVGRSRNILIRVTAPPNAQSVVMRVTGTRVRATFVDGRQVDDSHYRRKSTQWVLQYWAVPDSGAMIGLVVPAGREIDFDIASRVPGLPTISGVTIPPRPSDVVPAQDGDVSVVYRHSRF